jgi:hypothetical protein
LYAPETKIPTGLTKVEQLITVIGLSLRSNILNPNALELFIPADILNHLTKAGSLVNSPYDKNKP